MMRFTKIICSGLCLFSLTGCLSLLPQISSAPSVYRLTEPGEIVDKNPSAPIVMIRRTIAPNSLGGEDIVLSPDGQRIAYAAKSRWISPLPELVQHAALDSFARKPTVAVVLSPSTVRADYNLQMTLRQFEAEFDNGEEAPPLAKVSLIVSLTDNQTRKLVGTQQFQASQRAAETRVSDIVVAQKGATEMALDEMSNWVAARVNRSAMAVQ